MAKKLTAKRQRFVEEYIIDFNGTQAAIRAGYSKKTAYSIAEELLRFPEIQEAIKKKQDKTSKKLEITREKVIQEMARIGLSDVRKLFTDAETLKAISTLDDDTAAAIQSIEVVTKEIGSGEDKKVEYVHKVKLSDKIGALRDLGKHFNIYEDHAKNSAPKVEIHLEGKDARV